MRCSPEAPMSLELLARLQEEGSIRALDLHFARQLAACASADHAQIALLGALLSVELGRGHVCIELDALDGRRFADLEDAQAPLLDAALLRRVLQRATDVCATPADAQARPLLLDGTRLYLQRYWQCEQRVAARLRAMSQRVHALDPAGIALLHALHEDQSAGASGQKLACAVAVTRSLGVITGGPGTGKTSTVARLLLLLAAQAQARGTRLGVKLAAPTGKAAARVGESLARELGALRAAGHAPESLLAQLPSEALTLHRLLGARGSRGFAHDAGNPLAADVVVLDESSMVDLRLLDALLQALPGHARLLLLGDRDQLAAVEAGNVFGALCGAAGSFSAARAAELAAITALPVSGNAAAGTIADAIAVLRHSYRFDAGSGIGQLATAVNGGDHAAVAATLGSHHPDIGIHSVENGLQPAQFELIRAGYRQLLELARGAGEHAAIVRSQECFRVLCALRDGPGGVSGLNLAIENHLAGVGAIVRGQTFYAGRPLMITRNDHGLRLYNGDMGVVVHDDDGHPQVLFPRADGSFRSLRPGRLPPHETAWAMTVHKSQGSEFDTVLLAMPDEDGPLWQAALLYTGITRARTRLELVLPGATLDPRWLQRSSYRSGLGERLAWAGHHDIIGTHGTQPGSNE
jgi:exodeoxyribonuclease V alpha subunit